MFSSLRKWMRRKPMSDARRFYALNDLDRKLESHLDFEGGVFVEAGANNGVDQSNTMYFEKHRGWTGLLVEPIPELARRGRTNRPECIIEQAALVPPDYPESTIEMQYCNLMSLINGSMKSAEEDALHIAKGRECQNIKSYAVSVPARTLSSILDQHGLTQVDLLSLDVEGFELPALQGLDLTRHRPRFLLVEARFRDEIDAYLAPTYQVVDELSHHDVLYSLPTAA
jgi:FkbM family methyltransferase